MRKKTISRFPIPKLETLQKDIRERIAAVQEKAGFIPNVFLTLAHRPDEFRAFFAYQSCNPHYLLQRAILLTLPFLTT